MLKYTVHPGGTKMFKDLSAKVLVKRNEARSSNVHIKVFDLLANQGRAPTSRRFHAEDRDPSMKMKRYHYRFCGRFTANQTEARFDLGNYGQTHQVCSFLTYSGSVNRLRA